MSTLNFIITDAGRQAAINADATGVQLTVTEVGYGTGNWSPDRTATALQSELKRLPAGGGDNPAPLYVHIAVTDQSSDTYQAQEVAIYTGAVLFAVWSKGLQPDMDGPGKIASGDSAFVFDLLLDNVPPGSVTVGDANFSNPLATTEKIGVGEIATEAETSIGDDKHRWITPFTLHKYIAEWWTALDLDLSWSAITGKPDKFPPANHSHYVIGSNAFGYWKEWEDGRIECWGQVNFNANNGYITLPKPATYLEFAVANDASPPTKVNVVCVNGGNVGINNNQLPLSSNGVMGLIYWKAWVR
ncbi:hypothetical protein [Endozoicomonas ascidiicola]|uniref:hypothetical protein n=1 Tax=Endozoicomonas ascidiicola TaxID=1698521 RepID=UPI00082ED896|nr:hypothetical protein [Endozoicomonas ascidiicola]